MTINRRNFIKKSLFSAAGCASLAAAGKWIFSGTGSIYLFSPEKLSPVKRSIPLMGTIVTISIYDNISLENTNFIINKALKEFHSVNELMSVFDPDSQVSEINRASGNELITVDRKLLNVIGEAKRIGDLSLGTFDITVNPVLKALGFRNKDQTDSDLRKIEDLLSLVDYKKIFIDERNMQIGLEKTGMEIDLGGIAKGYAVDCAVKILRDEGVKMAVVSAGGDIYALGSPEGEDGWPIGIQDPMNPERIYARIKLKNRGIATSGNYEKHITHNNSEIGHLIDPRNGYYENNVLSSTVISSLSMEADALATGAYLLYDTKESDGLFRDTGSEYLFLENSGKDEMIDYSVSEEFPEIDVIT
ncbi:MAG: FAD:protein FMN transferase [bacterium]|nr:FAD:protein FMN transferase [bacterium]